MTEPENSFPTAAADNALRERTTFRRQLIATGIGAVVGFFCSGAIAVFQASQQARDHLTERQIGAIKALTQALAEAEVTIVEDIQMVEALDAMRQRAEQIRAKEPKLRPELIAKLEADDGYLNSQRSKVNSHWAQVDGSLRSAHIGLRGVFSDVPNLPLDSIEHTFFTGQYGPTPEDDLKNLQEHIKTYTWYRDAYNRSKTAKELLIAQQLEIVQRLLKASGR